MPSLANDFTSAQCLSKVDVGSTVEVSRLSVGAHDCLVGPEKDFTMICRLSWMGLDDSASCFMVT